MFVTLTKQLQRAGGAKAKFNFRNWPSAHPDSGQCCKGNPRTTEKSSLNLIRAAKPNGNRMRHNNASCGANNHYPRPLGSELIKTFIFCKTLWQGNSMNFNSWAKDLFSKLESTRRIIIPDLRNHGQSPHTSTMTYCEMMEDILALMDEEGIDKAEVIWRIIRASSFSADIPSVYWTFFGRKDSLRSGTLSSWACKFSCSAWHCSCKLFSRGMKWRSSSELVDFTSLL